MTPRAAIGFAALVAMIGAGCSWGSVPPLGVTAVRPDHVTRGVSLTVVVQGEGLDPEVVVDFDSPQASDVCATFGVELVSPLGARIPLERVYLVAVNSLAGRLPSAATGSAQRARWDVVVTDFRGRMATLASGFDILGCETQGAPCDDGEPTCTTGDACNGAARCLGVAVPDGTPCDFPCPAGATVAGSCLAGACAPAEGLCASPPACTAD